MKRENTAPIPIEILDTRGAAEYLCISVNAVGNLVNAGLLKCMVLGSRKFRLETLREFMEKWEGWDLSDPKQPKKL